MVQSTAIPVVSPRGRKPSRIPAAFIAFGLVLAGAVSDFAAPQTIYNNSLWIGTDNSTSRNVLNMDRSGVVLRSVGPVECTGFAISPDAGVIYFGNSTGAITSRDLNT